MGWLGFSSADASRKRPRLQVPTQLRVLADALPRNAMGKVNKKELLKLFTEGEQKGDEQASKKPRLEEATAAAAAADKK